VKIIYIDTETTGINPTRNAILQIAGTIAVNGQTEDFDIRMAPRAGAIIDAGAMKVNGISAEEARGYQSSEEAYKIFIQMLSRYVNPHDPTDKFYFVGYNSSFDMDFIREWFSQNNDRFFGSWFWYPSLDVMQLAAFKLIGRRILLPNFKLGTVYEAVLGKTFKDAHDARADIAATREILNAIIRDF